MTSLTRGVVITSVVDTLETMLVTTLVSISLPVVVEWVALSVHTL